MTPSKPFSFSIWGRDKAVVANATFITDRAGVLELLTTAENVGSHFGGVTATLPDASELDRLRSTAAAYATLVQLMGSMRDGSQTSVHINTDDAALPEETIQVSVGNRLFTGITLGHCLEQAAEELKTNS